jgi:hypothetical protein
VTNLANSPADLKKILVHVSLALKSFNLPIAEWKNPQHLGQLQLLYKKRKYIFYITSHLSKKEAYSEKFKQTVEFCDENAITYIIIAQTWDKELQEFADSTDFLWKIISFRKLTELGSLYLDRLNHEKFFGKSA